jgi:hypothetical protein
MEVVASGTHANKATHIKSDIKEFILVTGSGVIFETDDIGRLVAKVGVDTIDSGMNAVTGQFITAATGQGWVFLQMQNAIRLTMNTNMSRYARLLGIVSTSGDMS